MSSKKPQQPKTYAQTNPAYSEGFGDHNIVILVIAAAAEVHPQTVHLQACRIANALGIDTETWKIKQRRENLEASYSCFLG